MADNDEPDRLSQLPDELLHRILQLAPSREAESTAVLSRRWRGLWPPPASAVEFAIPSIASDRFHRRRRDASLLAAKEAVAAAAAHGRPVQRLSVHVGAGCGFADVVAGDVLSRRACRDVQDVRLVAGDDDDDDDSSWSWRRLADRGVGEFEFSIGAVAAAAGMLRVLQITNCRELTPPPSPGASTFPNLEVLRLRKCSVHLPMLQDMVVASPRLAALQLEHVFLSTEPRSRPMTAAQWQASERERQGYYNRRDGYYYSYIDVGDYSERLRWDDMAQSLCCPGITTLVLLNCCVERDNNYVAVELDVPRVQHLRYRGKVNQFTLRSPLPDVRRVHLHILLGRYVTGDILECEMLCNLLKNFGDAKVLKLKLENLIDIIALPGRKGFRELLGETTLFKVEHLEIEARHNPTSHDAIVAIGNLLQCCPFIVDLRLKLNTAHKPMTMRRRNSTSTFRKNKAQLLEFRKSVDHFRRRRDRPVVPLCGDDDKVEVLSDIPGLSDRWLPLHLRRLSLQFQMGDPGCVGVRLAKFFVDRAMALEEMYIDDGNMRLWEHMNCRLSGYAASPQPSSEQHVLAIMSEAISVNKFSSLKISGWLHHRRLEVRRTRAVNRSFTILPLADA